MNKSISGAFLEITSPRLISSTKISENCSSFSYGPFAPGYSLTIGNSLRRILLSSIQGCGIVYIKAEGYTNICSTIPNVEQDLLEIVQRLKLIRFKMNSAMINVKEVVINFGELMKSYPKNENGSFILMSSMIKDDVVEVLNNVHLCTVNAPTIDLIIRLFLEKGAGYIDPHSMQRNHENVPYGCISINSPLNAVRRVCIHPTKKMPYGDFTSYEVLDMEIETDGSINPEQAFEKGLEIFSGVIQSMQSFSLSCKQDIQTQSEPVTVDIMNKPITELKLKEAILRTLDNEGMLKISDLCSLTKEAALKLPRLGITKVLQIQEALAAFGLNFRQDSHYRRDS